MFLVELYSTANGNEPVQDYIRMLIRRHKTREIAQINLYQERLRQYGPQVNAVYPDTIKHLRDSIFELRPSATRVFFFFFDENRIILLHAFEKKQWKVPNPEIKKAIKERNDFLRRNTHE